MLNIEYLDIEQNQEYEKTICQVVEKCFEIEKLPTEKLLVSITLTNAENIKELNNKYRKINQPTDVLSFPMFEKEEIQKMISQNIWKYNDILGDMVISIPKVKEQAIEYGHSFERELSYMVVHSFYHLMGYDHIEDAQKEEMRKKEENVLSQLGVTRK